MVGRNWRTILGGLVTLYGVAASVLDLVGYVDLVIAHRTAPAQTWLGKVMDFALAPPSWTAIPLVAVGLVLIWWDTRVRAARARAEGVVPIERLADADLKKQATKWLVAKLSARGLHIAKATLFGSIVHNHFETSDVDVIVKFDPLRESQIAAAVRKIKGPLASEFKRQFGHDLHVKFFCAEEIEGHQAFLADTKHETII